MQALTVERSRFLQKFGFSRRASEMVAKEQPSKGNLKFHNADSERPELLIYEQIGFDWFSGEGVTAKAFAEQLAAFRGKELTVRINSPGGDVFDGLAIHNALAQHRGDVRVIVDGIAASIASVIAMAGNSIGMQKASQFMIHSAWTVAAGNANDMREIADVLEKIDGQIAGVYSDRTKTPKSAWLDVMSKDSYFTSDESLELGLTDEILTPAGGISNRRGQGSGSTASNGRRLQLMQAKRGLL